MMTVVVSGFVAVAPLKFPTMSEKSKHTFRHHRTSMSAPAEGAPTHATFTVMVSGRLRLLVIVKKSSQSSPGSVGTPVSHVPCVMTKYAPLTVIVGPPAGSSFPGSDGSVRLLLLTVYVPASAT